MQLFGDIPGILVHYLKIILNFFYVSQSVCLLTSILKLYKCRDIYSSGWDIFLIFLETFLGCCHYFQIILNFLFVCHSVSWLTSLLKLDKYRDTSSSGWDIFLIFLEIFLGCWYTCWKWFWTSSAQHRLASDQDSFIYS